MSIAGKWNLTLNSPLGDQNATLDVSEAAGAYQATLAGRGDPNPVEDLKVDGSKLAFAADTDTPVGRMRLGFDGEVTGDALTGTYSTPFGAFKFSGTRA